jgi:hypothetical protein
MPGFLRVSSQCLNSRYQINVREAGYKDTRVRLQRIADARFFSGWIVEMSNKDASILLNDLETMEVGDIVVGEVSGRENRALFDAQVTKTLQDVTHFDFRRTPRYEPSRENPRTLVRNVSGMLSFQGEDVDVSVLDVSVGGIGFLTYAPLPVGSLVKFCLETPHGPVKVSGEVRYCRSDAHRFGLYRAGALITELGRLDRARWNKMNYLIEAA